MKANAWTKDLSARATQELLTMDDPPDAIFASTSDFSALGVLESAAKLGISVPQQLGVCGYSNEAFTEISNPSITTLDQHSITIGKTIAHLYFDELLNTEQISRTVVINPDLIIRNSTNRV
jgi:LacI family transcriptional regulator